MIDFYTYKVENNIYLLQYSAMKTMKKECNDVHASYANYNTSKYDSLYKTDFSGLKYAFQNFDPRLYFEIRSIWPDSEEFKAEYLSISDEERKSVDEYYYNIAGNMLDVKVIQEYQRSRKTHIFTNALRTAIDVASVIAAFSLSVAGLPVAGIVVSYALESVNIGLDLVCGNYSDAFKRVVLIAGSELAGLAINKIIQIGSKLFKAIAASCGDDVARAIARFSNNFTEMGKYYDDAIVLQAKRFFAEADDYILKNPLGFDDLMPLEDAAKYDQWIKLREAGLDQAKINDIILTNKGFRPDPSTYLTQEYIDAHLDLFEDGVTKIVCQAPIGTAGPPTGTFVMPSSVADDLILKANGDILELERSLGLTPGSLGDNPVRLDINYPINLRLPSGNELGANSQWIPGGYTSGGLLEAVIDSPQIGEYTVISINQKGAIKWK